MYLQHLALEMQAQQTDSSKYTPLPVARSDNSGLPDQQTLPYPQYLATVKQQISCAKDMYDLLSEFTRTLARTDKPAVF